MNWAALINALLPVIIQLIQAAEKHEPGITAKLLAQHIPTLTKEVK